MSRRAEEASMKLDTDHQLLRWSLTAMTRRTARRSQLSPQTGRVRAVDFAAGAFCWEPATDCVLHAATDAQSIGVHRLSSPRR